MPFSRAGFGTNSLSQNLTALPAPSERATLSVIATRCQLPRRGSFWRLRACSLPLGGAVAQRLRGYKSAKPEKTVKRSSRRTGVNLQFFPVGAHFFRIVKGVQPLVTGCGTQHPLRALGGTRVLLAAAPTTPPCFRRWRRSSSLLLRGGWSPEVGRGESEHPSLPLAQRSVLAR